MLTALYIVIYLIGCIFGYLYCRYNLRKVFEGNWTKSDRRFSLVISLFSWIAVLAMGIVHVVIETTNNDEPASW